MEQERVPRLEWVRRAENEFAVRSLDLKRLETFQTFLSDDGSFLLTVLDLYVNVAPTSLEKIRFAIEEGSLSQIHETAHSMKSSSANIGADQLAKLCASLEKETGPAQRGKETNPSQLFEEIAKEMGLVLAEISIVQGLLRRAP